MSGFWNLNLIHLFDFYLTLAFLLSSYRRIGQYRAIGGLAVTWPGRWPRLLKLIRQHHMIFLTWSTVLPGIIAFSLTLLQILASRVLWHQHAAECTVANLPSHWLPLVLLGLLGAGMLAVDGYFIIAVGEIDRPMMEKYFDEAEGWLRSWQAPVVKFFTLGRINPRQMVRVEVQKALLQASQLINTNLWWFSLQIGLRVAFGVTLWLTFAGRDPPF
jgi:hypothetical protein